MHRGAGLNKNHFGKLTFRHDLSRAISPKEVLIDLPRADQVSSCFTRVKLRALKTSGVISIR